MKLYNLGCADLFRCVFCRNLAKKPKIMSCMHTACHDCLRKHFEPESSQIMCKACDAVNTVKNVETFGNHDYVRNILDIVMTQANSDNFFTKCSECEAEVFENTLLFTCLTCSGKETGGGGNGDTGNNVGQSKLLNMLELAVKPTARTMLCSNCFDHHCIQNQSHSVFACLASTSGAEMLSKEEGRVAECRKHKQTLTSFCLKLKRPMCEVCLKSHNSAGHSHLCGMDVKCHVKSSVECGKRFQTNIHAYNRRANEIKESFKKEKEANAQNTKKLFQKLRDILDQNENRIMQQLDDVYAAKFTQLTSVEEQGSFFADLGDRLTQTASDLLCLSSEQETYSFVSIIDTVASQLTQFSAGLEEEVRLILKDKPETSFKKRLFEDFVKTQYVSVEVKTANLVDSLCCSLSDVPESRLTQLTISSDVLTGLEPNNNSIDITAKDFKVELSMPGRQPVFVHVDSKESIESVPESEQGSNAQVKSIKFIAYIDPDTVTAGVYNLKVTFRDQLIKSGPDSVKIYPKFDSDEVSNSLLDRVNLSLFEQSLPSDYNNDRLRVERFLSELDDDSDSAEEQSGTVVQSQPEKQGMSPDVDYDIGSSISAREAPPNIHELNNFMHSPLETIQDDEQSLNLSSVIRNRNEEYQRNAQIATGSNFDADPRSAIINSNWTSRNDGSRNNDRAGNQFLAPCMPTSPVSGSVAGSGLVLSAIEKPAPMPKPKPSNDAHKLTPNNQELRLLDGPEAQHAPFNNLNDNSRGGVGGSNFGFRGNYHSNSGRGRFPNNTRVQDPAFPEPSESRGTQRLSKRELGSIQTQHQYANLNSSSKRYVGHISEFNVAKGNGTIFYSNEYKNALFEKKECVYGPEKSVNGSIRVRRSDNVMFRIVHENNVGYAKDIWILPFPVDTMVVSKCIPHFVGTIVSFNPGTRAGVIENFDGRTIRFNLNAVVKENSDSSDVKILNGYFREVLYSVYFHNQVFYASEVRCLRANEQPS